MKKISAIFLFLSCLGLQAFAQTPADKERTAYLETITKRAAKIVAAIGPASPRDSAKVTALVRDQYDDLNDIYIARDAKLARLKSAEAGNTQAAKDEVARDTKDRLQQLHVTYLKKLGKYLSAEQIEGIKNGMTYNVLPITYKAYQEQIPSLTEAHKAQILSWLTEARELAMDAESAEKKHGWFGKYKGRINNYLSKEGFDLKKESADWEKRRKANLQVR
ncbi:DUF3826 domain-containing protein [Pedobacter sp. SYP-B3415]|uniref:DUF3826 domain-containing protein n=1 Tax=Pedobacter sp. SYP-B3415 TaxID=2496641 RepID=UPI00101B7757|nr:DUF3826 domain-containing protein [Pedobacter sp. SYP-B3415]